MMSTIDSKQQHVSIVTEVSIVKLAFRSKPHSAPSTAFRDPSMTVESQKNPTFYDKVKINK